MPRGAGDRFAQCLASREGVEHRLREGLLLGNPRLRLRRIELLHPRVGVVEALSVQRVAAPRVSACGGGLAGPVHGRHRMFLHGASVLARTFMQEGAARL